MQKKTKLDFHDLQIMPAAISKIGSRSEINPYKKNGFLPLMTAPMDTVIDEINGELFLKNKINAVLPRGEQIYWHGTEFAFNSYGLDEFISKFVNVDDMSLCFAKEHTNYALIDVANGHMQKLLDTVRKSKEMYGDRLILMVGNIANPETYEILSEAGADYLRISIGNGGACLTAKQLSIGYPTASLLMECKKLKGKHNLKANIIADGGMKSYSDIIMSLALGADYVMIGSIFNKCLESCGDTYLFNTIKINQYSKFAKWLFKNNFKLTKKFRGMSTKEVQRKWNRKTIKTSEGVSKKQNVEYTIEKWVENFEDYLRSAMSYVDAKTLEEFSKKAEIIKISNNAYNRFNK